VHHAQFNSRAHPWKRRLLNINITVRPRARRPPPPPSLPARRGRAANGAASLLLAARGVQGRGCLRPCAPRPHAGLEFARFLETTRDDEAHAQIPILWRQKDCMQLLKTRLIEKSMTSSFAQSPIGQKGQNECLRKETYQVHRLRLNRRPLNRKRGSPTKLA
jgi:hypothetical protein